MTTVRVPPGVVRGESKASIPGRVWDCNLIRWQNGRMVPVGGWERNNASALLSIPRASHVWDDGDGVRHRLIMCDAHVYRVQNDIYTAITPAGFLDANSTAAQGYGSGLHGLKDYGQDDEARGAAGSLDVQKPLYFSIENWAFEVLFGSSADGRVWVWNPATPGTAPALAVNVPVLVQSFIVTNEHHLMVFGYQGNPSRVAWSGQNDRADWDFADVTGSAGFFDLEAAGQIYCGRKIPGGILVFTSAGVWLGRYIGAPYYYGFDKIVEGAAPISPHAIVVAGNRVIWLGRSSFWQYQGGVITPLSTTLGLLPFGEWDKRAAPRRVTAGFNGAHPEAWFFYPSEQLDLAPVQVENDRYIIFDFEAGWWATGYVGRSAYNAAPLDGVPFAGDEQGWIYQHEIGYKAEGATRAGMVYADIGTISFDDGAHNWQVNQFMIDSPEGPESVKFSFKGKTIRGGPEKDLGAWTPRPNGLVDAHFTARDFTMHVEGVTDSPWAIGALKFNRLVMRGA